MPFAEMETSLSTESIPVPPADKGAGYEKLGFTFCKAATIILLARDFALPVAAGATAVFYVLAHLHGQRQSRCILQWPLLIATFWGAIGIVSLYLKVHAMLGHPVRWW